MPILNSASGSPSEQRGAPRLSVSLPAGLNLLDGTFACELEDVSTTGARIALTPAIRAYLRIGTSGILECNPLQVFCSVRWITDTSAGLQFEEPVSIGQVRMLRWHNDIRAKSSTNPPSPKSAPPKNAA